MSSSKPLKILHLDSGKEWRGGQRQVLFLIEEQKQQFSSLIEPIIACPHISPLTKEAKNLNVPTYAINFRNEIDIFSISKLAKLIKNNQIDIVHCHCGKSHGIMWAACKLLPQIPSIIVTRRVDFLPKTSWPRVLKYISPHISEFVAISSRIQEILATTGIPEERIHVIPSSSKVSLPIKNQNKIIRNNLITELNLPKDAILIGNIAQFVDHKGHTYLADAAKIICDKFERVYFLLVGSGKLRKTIEEKIAKLKLSNRVLFLGFRPDVHNILSSLDLFLMTSHLEGLCSSIIDAFLYEVPVVATAAGGIPDLVKDNKTGYLANNRDPDSIAQEIMKCINHQDETKHLVQNAKEYAINTFSTHIMAQKYNDLYINIMRNK